MTLRAKTTVKRSHRPPSEGDHRRNLYLNIGFGVVVVVALLILAGAGFASWYGDHLAALASVNGQSISKDDFVARANVDSYRLNYQETQIRQLMQDGKLDATTGQNELTNITNSQNSLDTDSIENLIDATLQAQLATQMGVTVTDQQVTDEMTKEATTPEMRHVWIIGVKPKLSGTETTPSAAESAAAKAIADKGLADIKAGVAWDTVAKTMADDVYSSTSGDAGWVQADNAVIDPTLLSALFTEPVNGVTDVQLGADGLYRIGRVTEIAPATVDQAFTQKIQDSGIGLDNYKKVAKADALKQAITDKLVSDSIDKPTVQRHVAEIFLSQDTTQGSTGTGDEVEVRHILFSPNHDPNNASTVPATDPAWKTAETEADAAYAAVIKDPSEFAALAQAQSDDTGTKDNGGLLPYETQAALDPAFGAAIFAPGLKPDQILQPVKSAFGWHVIQFIDRRKQPADRMTDIISQASAPGADFGAIAKANSEAPDAANGGDAGWIARNQLDTVREIAIFKAPVGGLTTPITTTTGIYLYKILAEDTRLPDASQIATIKSSAFTNWYTAQKGAANIQRFYDTSSSSLPAVQ
jgi:parvulin-like peptidyl-prolyl isomerase